MKEIKILIRITEDKIGFLIDKEKETEISLPEKLQLIAALDLLKQNELEKIKKTFEAKKSR